MPFTRLRRKQGTFSGYAVLNRFAGLNLAMVLLILLLRVGQYILLLRVNYPASSLLWLEWKGFLYDLALWLTIAWILILPYFLLSLAGRRAGILFFGVVAIAAVMIEEALFAYFRIAAVPLDQVIFSYGVREMVLIILQSVRPDLLSILFFFLVAAIAIFLLRIALRYTLPRWLMAVLFAAGVSALFLRKPLAPDPATGKNPFEYYLATNKTAYLAEKIGQYLGSGRQHTADADIEAAAKRYQARHPEFSFVGTEYPFLHKDETPDVLGDFFNLGPEKPNLVFVIVESLSTCFMGDSPIFGSFAPFLDSLGQHSLRWPNFLSTADRTFNVLPALFGSLPPGDPTFVNTASRMPNHLTLIRYLHDNGYFTTFYYTGDPKFNLMSDFLQRQHTDLIASSFKGQGTPGEIITEGYRWGSSDDVLFSDSFRVIDSVKKTPRLDIYLTLSLHSPFVAPEREHYLAHVAERLQRMNPGESMRKDIEGNKDIFATILYTDDALRRFMQAYRKRADFANTIFIITGDHGLPELNLFRFSSLAMYNVPLIIYSPMLRQPRMMRSVSSHLDVAPSVLAMMRARYGIRTRPLAAWLGSGIDTSVAPRNLHSFPIILNSKEIIEYIRHSDYLWKDRLYEILPGLWLKDSYDRAALQQLHRELTDFKILNTYVTKQDKLIPMELCYGKAIDTADIPIVEQVPLSPADSTGEYHLLFWNQPVSDSLERMNLTVSVGIATRETEPQKSVKLVIEIRDSADRILLWHALDFSPPVRVAGMPAGWKTLALCEPLTISHLRSVPKKTMKVYLWNPAHRSIRFYHDKIHLTGYY